MKFCPSFILRAGKEHGEFSLRSHCDCLHVPICGILQNSSFSLNRAFLTDDSNKKLVSYEMGGCSSPGFGLVRVPAWKYGQTETALVGQGDIVCIYDHTWQYSIHILFSLLSAFPNCLLQQGSYRYNH